MRRFQINPMILVYRYCCTPMLEKNLIRYSVDHDRRLTALKIKIYQTHFVDSRAEHSDWSWHINNVMTEIDKIFYQKSLYFFIPKRVIVRLFDWQYNLVLNIPLRLNLNFASSSVKFRSFRLKLLTENDDKTAEHRNIGQSERCRPIDQYYYNHFYHNLVLFGRAICISLS
jgi:hypothetical protein